jgi:hypothetical protein
MLMRKGSVCRRFLLQNVVRIRAAAAAGPCASRDAISFPAKSDVCSRPERRRVSNTTRRAGGVAPP